MSNFEFVSVVLAIVIGLGITRILSGLGLALEHRSTLRFSGGQATLDLRGSG